MPGAPTAGSQVAFENKAQLEKGVSPQEVQRKERELRALAGMAGARQSAGEAGLNDSDEGSKEKAAANLADSKAINTIALNIADDKAQTNLSDILLEKLTKNDTEGKMLKALMQNKKDFILQLNNISFRVNFDNSSNAFKVAIDKGNSLEAKRILPQLEKFFNRDKPTAASLRATFAQ